MGLEGQYTEQVGCYSLRIGNGYPELTAVQLSYVPEIMQFSKYREKSNSEEELLEHCDCDMPAMLTICKHKNAIKYCVSRVACTICDTGIT